jgi:hypothetical protein
LEGLDGKKNVAPKAQRNWEEAGGEVRFRKKGATEAQRHRGARQGRKMAEPLRVPPYCGWWSAWFGSLFASFSSEKEGLALLQCAVTT